MNENRKSRWHVWILALGTIALLIAVSGVFTWSPINCWHEDIDIRSGRIRYTWYLLFVCIHDRVASTPASEALDPEDFDAAVPEWHRVNTFSPGTRHSPHYRYHGANAQIKTLKMIWGAREFTPAARRQSVLRLLSAWQRGESYFAARDYINSLWDVVAEHEKKGLTGLIDVDDIPSNDVEVE